MPLSFEATKTRSTLIDLLQAPTFKEMNYADKAFWSAHFGSEIDELKEEIKNGLSVNNVQKRLEGFQGLVGRLSLSPVVYGLGLLDLQKFLRAEIQEPEAHLAVIKEIRREWREALRQQKAFALENFAIDILNAVNYVAKAQWDVQTGREVLAYYYGLIAQPYYQSIVDLVRTFFSKYFTERYDEAGIRVITYCSKEDYQAFKQQLQQLFVLSAQSLTVIKSVEEQKIANVPVKSYSEQIWSTAKALGDYVITHPGQILTMGLATQVVGAAAWQVVRDVSASPTATVTLTPSASISISPSPSNSPGVESAVFRVSTYTNNDQNCPSVASLTNENNVVVWQSYEQDGSNYGIYGRIFTSNGTVIGTEFQVNTYTISRQSDPNVASLTNGNFVVVWDSYGQDGSNDGVYGKLFASTGIAIGTEFQVNVFTNGAQLYPSVAGLTNGNFIVAWESDGQDGSGYGVYGRLFTSNAAVIGTEFRINTYITNNQFRASVASLTNGNFIVTWSSIGQDGYYSGIYGQLFAGNGTAIGTEFRVNTYTIKDQVWPSASGLTNGNFIVIWNSYEQDGSGYGIYGQLFTSNCNFIGTEFRINSYTYGDQYGPRVASLANGNFVVSWYAHYSGILGKIFDASANTIAEEITIYPSTSSNGGDQTTPSVTGLTGNNFVVMWRSWDGSSAGIYGQIKSLNIWPSPSITPSPSSTSSVTPTSSRTPSVSPTATPNCAVSVCPSSSPSRSPTPSVSPIPALNRGAFRIDTNLNGNNPAVASFNDDSFIVTWQNYQNGFYDIYGQLFDNGSNKIGVEFPVNTYMNNSQINPAVASFNGGNFAIVWESNGQDGSSTGIYGQLFDHATTKFGTEFLVNTYVNGTQSNPAVVSFSDNSFVVVWQSQYQDGSDWGIYGQRFDGFGNKIDNEFLVNTNTTGTQNNPAIASFNTGNFVVVWSGVYGQLFNQTAGKIGTEFRVNLHCGYPVIQHAVAALSNNFLVMMRITNYPYGYAAFCTQLFTSDGVETGYSQTYGYYTYPYSYAGSGVSNPGFALSTLSNENFNLVFQDVTAFTMGGSPYSYSNLNYQTFNSSGITTGLRCFATGQRAFYPTTIELAAAGLMNEKFVAVWSYQGIYGSIVTNGVGSFCATLEMSPSPSRSALVTPSRSRSPSITPTPVPSSSASSSATQSPALSPSITPSHSRSPSITPTAISSPTTSSSAVLSASPSGSPTSTAGDHAKSSMSILDAFLKVSLPTTVGATLLLIMGWKIRNYLKAKHSESEKAQADNRNSFFASKTSYQDEEASSRSVESMRIAEGSDKEDEDHAAPMIIRGAKH